MNIEYFLTALASSSLVIGVVAFVAKKWFEGRVDFENKRQLERLKAELDARAKISEEVAKRYLDGTMSIAEAIYRCRNHARSIADAMQSGKNVKADDIGGIMENTYKITDHLYRYGILMNESHFTRIHIYKNTAQRLVIGLDDAIRPTTKESGKTAFLKYQPELEEQYKEIISSIRLDRRLMTIFDE